MKATDSIKLALENSKNFSEALFKDMSDQPFARTRPGAGQHAYWLLGHIVVSESFLLDQSLLGKPNRFESWLPYFDFRTEAAEQGNGAPTYEELIEAMGSIRQSTIEHIESLTDDDLDKQCCEVSEDRPKFQSVGDCLNTISWHMVFHTGQVASARAAAGRDPLFA